MGESSENQGIVPFLSYGYVKIKIKEGKHNFIELVLHEGVEEIEEEDFAYSSLENEWGWRMKSLKNSGKIFVRKTARW